MFGDGQTRQRNAGARPGRLVHLAVNQRALRPFGRTVVLVRVLVHARLDHLVIEVVAFARTLTDTREHGVTAVRLRDVVDELLNENRLAHAGAAEEADLAAARIGREQVDDLDARDEHFGFRRLFDEGRRFLVDFAGRIGLDRTGFVHRLANDVDDAAERSFANRHGDRAARILHFLAANETFRRIHRDGTDGVLAEVLRDFENEALAIVLRLKRIQDGRQVTVELDVHNGANHLTDLADNIAHTVYPCFACREAADGFPSSCLRRVNRPACPFQLAFRFHMDGKAFDQLAIFRGRRRKRPGPQNASRQDARKKPSHILEQPLSPAAPATELRHAAPSDRPAPPGPLVFRDVSALLSEPV